MKHEQSWKGVLSRLALFGLAFCCVAGGYLSFRFVQILILKGASIVSERSAVRNWTWEKRNVAGLVFESPVKLQPVSDPNVVTEVPLPLHASFSGIKGAISGLEMTLLHFEESDQDRKPSPQQFAQFTADIYAARNGGKASASLIEDWQAERLSGVILRLGARSSSDRQVVRLLFLESGNQRWTLRLSCPVEFESQANRVIGSLGFDSGR